MTVRQKPTLKDWMQVKFFYLPFPVAAALSIAVLGGLVLNAALTSDVQPQAHQVERSEQKAAKSGETHSCTTTGPNSPIVTGKNSVVVVNGKTHVPGQSADCTPGATSISTHGAGSPIVTGAGANVTSVVEP